MTKESIIKKILRVIESQLLTSSIKEESGKRKNAVKIAEYIIENNKKEIS